FSRLGGAIIPFLFLGLFQLFGTWTNPFWSLAVLGVVWCAIFWPWFRNRPEEMPQVNAAERELIAAGRADPAPRLVQSVPWKKMFTSPSVWGLCSLYACGGFAGNFVTNLLPTYLEHYRGLTPKAATWIQSLTLSSGLVSCLLGGVLS